MKFNFSVSLIENIFLPMDNLDYGIIGNCQSAALISKTGSLDWCCLPNFDSNSIFAKILDQKKGGSFEIITTDDYFKYIIAFD